MRAAFLEKCGDPEVIQFGEVPDPELGPGQVLVRVHAAGLNFADIYRRRGEYALSGGAPYVLGYEGAGEIVAVGAGVEGWKIGERVGFADVPRTNAERIVCPEDRLIRLPNEVSYEVAAASLLQGLTAQYLVHDSRVLKAGEHALVHAGASGVGLFLLQYIRQIGAQSTAIVSNEGKARAARDAGANRVLVVPRSPPDLALNRDWITQAGEVARKHPFDVVYDSVGSTVRGSLEVVRDGGQVVFYGWAGGAPPSIDPQYLLNHSKSITGGDLWIYLNSGTERRKRAALLFNDLASGKLSVTIAERFTLAEAARAHRYMESGENIGKVLLLG